MINHDYNDTPGLPVFIFQYKRRISFPNCHKMEVASEDRQVSVFSSQGWDLKTFSQVCSKKWAPDTQCSEKLLVNNTKTFVFITWLPDNCVMKGKHVPTKKVRKLTDMKVCREQSVKKKAKQVSERKTKKTLGIWYELYEVTNLLNFNPQRKEFLADEVWVRIQSLPLENLITNNWQQQKNTAVTACLSHRNQISMSKCHKTKL